MTPNTSIVIFLFLELIQMVVNINRTIQYGNAVNEFGKYIFH